MPAPETSPPAFDRWPRCPRCGAQRSTRCPFCCTAGTKFTSAETDFGQLFGLGGTSDPGGPCCGPGGCTPGSLLGRNSSGADKTDSPPAAMLLCPTCDEPFEPTYRKRCEWCGHEFPDGSEPKTPPAPAESLNLRIVVTVVVLLALLGAIAIYLRNLF